MVGGTRKFGGSRNDKKLSTEDRLLWKKVTDTLAPIHGRIPYRSVEAQDMADLLASTAPNSGTPEPTAPKADTSGPKPPTPFLEPYYPPTSKASPVAEPIDRKTRRKLSKGAVPLGARLDLHGMTQDRAHAALIGFLRRRQAEGHRHVLVITGKGLAKQGQGVLRKMVPRWFASPPLSSIVNGYEWAAASHGGDGALYVRLRRPKGRGT